MSLLKALINPSKNDAATPFLKSLFVKLLNFEVKNATKNLFSVSKSEARKQKIQVLKLETWKYVTSLLLHIGPVQSDFVCLLYIFSSTKNSSWTLQNGKYKQLRILKMFEN